MISEKRASELHRDILGDWVILEFFEESLSISGVVVRCRRGHGLFDTGLEPGLYVSDMPNTSPPAHVIVRLPYNRPENAVDPPVVRLPSSAEFARLTCFQVEWSAEKEAYLWDIISRSRGPAGSGTDCSFLS